MKYYIEIVGLAAILFCTVFRLREPMRKIKIVNRVCKKVWRELCGNKIYYILIFSLHSIYTTFESYNMFHANFEHEYLLNAIENVFIGIAITLIWACLNAFICIFSEDYRHNLLIMPIICLFMVFSGFFEETGILGVIACSITVIISNVVYLKMLITTSGSFDFKEDGTEAHILEKYLIILLIFLLGVIVLGTTVLFIQESTNCNYFTKYSDYVDIEDRFTRYINTFELSLFNIVPFGDDTIINMQSNLAKVLTALCAVYKFAFITVFLDSILSSKRDPIEGEK